MSLREWSLDEVKTHKSLSDCWIIISNRVYDVTEFLARHPAGGKIVAMHGGRDCTAAFLDVHRERYLTQFLPAASFKGVVAGSGAKAPPEKFVGQYWAPDQVLSMKRTVYTQEHEAYRAKFKEFISKHIHPVSWGRGSIGRRLSELTHEVADSASTDGLHCSALTLHDSVLPVGYSGVRILGEQRPA